MEKIRTLISREQIAEKVRELGKAITDDFAGEPVILVGILKGATIFLADLAREISLDATFDFIAVSSYGKEKQHSGQVQLIKDLDESIEGKNVILVEDILDTGITMTYLQSMLMTRCPKTLKLAILLDKKERRLQPVHADYIGFVIPDEFVVGYGLDFAERYRNLPEVCILESGEETN